MTGVRLPRTTRNAPNAVRKIYQPIDPIVPVRPPPAGTNRPLLWRRMSPTTPAPRSDLYASLLIRAQDGRPKANVLKMLGECYFPGGVAVELRRVIKKGKRCCRLATAAGKETARWPKAPSLDSLHLRLRPRAF